jgi:hypothetical protein
MLNVIHYRNSSQNHSQTPFPIHRAGIVTRQGSTHWWGGCGETEPPYTATADKTANFGKFIKR